MRTFAERFQSGSDLKDELRAAVEKHGIKAGVLLSVVGSLSQAELRTAGGADVLKLDGPLEIVSATGTFASGGTMHVHLSVADHKGSCKGGHLMPGCKIFTTAEVVIGDLGAEWSFDRAPDPMTSHLELVIHKAEME